MTFEQLLLKRIERSGDTSPGAYSLAADLFHIAADEAEHRANCGDTAIVAGWLDGAVEVLDLKAKMQASDIPGGDWFGSAFKRIENQP